MAKIKIKVEDQDVESTAFEPVVASELEQLQALHEELKTRRINSIGDLENQIARLV